MITNLTIFAMLMQVVSLEGRVRDAQTGKPLQLVRIQLLSRGTPTNLEYTDVEGRFRFADVVPGTYTVSAVSAGYEAKNIEWDVTIPGPLEIELTRTAGRAHPSGSVVSIRDYLIPGSARKEFDRARKEIKRQDCSKAVGHLENGLRLASDSSALNDLGNCYRLLGDFERAEASFKRAMELSDSVYIALNLAETYTAQKRFKEAESILALTIQRKADNGDAYFGLAAAYVSQGRFQEAEAAALQADSRPHRIADLHLILAKMYLRTKPDKVADQLELYLKEAPNSAESDRVRKALEAAKRK